MAHSFRKPYSTNLCRSDPRSGKRFTSGEIRAAVRDRLIVDGEDFDFSHPLDRTRGTAGIRDPDYGWSFFGDGHHEVLREDRRARYARK